ncbi:MAG: response regulator transcription factor [Burkholderiales bacterium]|nr:response regulator transcription factor [Burkholderiales bacterium]
MTRVLRAIVVDDEPLARMRMRALLTQASQPVEVMGEFGDAVSAYQALKAWDEQGQGPDVLFLDIAMPGPSGLQMAGQLSSLARPPQLVFVTAHPEHAVQAFDLAALDYLTKPIRLERLEACLTRVAQRRAADQADAAPSPDALLVHDRGALVRVPLREVLYFKAEQKYVTVRTTGQTWVMDESLSDLEQRLGARFIRVHRNALVAREAMSKLERREDLEPGQEVWALQVRPTQEWLAVSRRQVALVKETMASCA